MELKSCAIISTLILLLINVPQIQSEDETIEVNETKEIEQIKIEITDANSTKVIIPTDPGDTKKFFGDLYETGKKSFLANDWKNCVAKIEASLISYAWFRTAILKCKQGCRDDTEAAFMPLNPENIENIHFFEKTIKQTLCLMNCKNLTMPDMNKQISKEILDDFERKLPYDYLQLCYYQLKDLDSASAAAFTYHVYNPDNTIMKDNIKWYTEILDSKKKLVNREPQTYSKSYESGVRSFSEENWGQTVEHFEKAVTEFLTSENECRIECEKPFDMGWFPDFVTSVANHYVYCLKCKQLCQLKLANMDGNFVENILPLMFNYLQFSYYKLGKIREAVECVESYLLLDPNHQDMINNKNYYQAKENAEASWFVVRPEVQKFFNRDAYEKDLLEFINVEFSYYNTVAEAVKEPEKKENLIVKPTVVKQKGDDAPLPNAVDEKKEL